MSTYTNMGTEATALSSSTIAGADIGVSRPSISFDITTAAKSWLNGTSSNYGIAFKPGDGLTTRLSMMSKDRTSADDSMLPKLVWEYYTPDVQSGGYRIKNVATGKYLDVTDGSITSGTYLQQWDGTDGENSRNQLFKITFSTITSNYGYSYYSIRPMTNSGQCLYSAYASTVGASVQDGPTSDAWSTLPYNKSWEIRKIGSYYIIRNGTEDEKSYLSTISGNNNDGARIITTSTITDNSRWILEPYEGERIRGCNWINSETETITNHSFQYKATMYDSVIGTNGPVRYEVVNEDNTVTNLASIDQSTGWLTTNSLTGTMKVRAVYTNSPVYYILYIPIEESKEGTSFLENNYFEKPMQNDNDVNYSNNGTSFELWDYDYYIDQRFELVYVKDGYYKILSMISGKALTAPSSSLLAGLITQTDYTGENTQLWKITSAGTNLYKFSPKSDLNKYMCAGEGVFESDGRNIRLRATSGSRDIWKIIDGKSKAIIIIPGITGSNLQEKNGETVWISATSNLQLKLECYENGQPKNSILPQNKTNQGALFIYANIYDRLQEDYGDEYDIIFFAYDWRLSNTISANKLQEITDLYDECVFVAHSMGGLVASKFLSISAENRNKVDKFIAVGTPFTGSVRIQHIIETGAFIDDEMINDILSNNPIINVQIGEILDQFLTAATSNNIKIISKNAPAVYELLPTQRYIYNDSYYLSVNNSFITTHQSSWGYMKTLPWAKKSDETIKPMFDVATSFHDSLITNGIFVSELPDVDTYKIVGIGTPTITSLSYNSDHELIDAFSSENGDGMVIASSALNNQSTENDKIYVFEQSHIELIKSNESVNLICSIINGTPAENLIANASINCSSTNNTNNIEDNTYITLLAYNFDSFKITDAEGHELYEWYGGLYYDENGESHKVGYYWPLGHNSYKYFLDIDNYTVTNLMPRDITSTIKIGCSNHPNGEYITSFSNIEAGGKIFITDSMLSENIEEGITVQSAS